jgi:alpha-tubulin suppressor-like RCC1 family protein
MPPSGVNVGQPVEQVTAGGFHTCVLTTSKAVRCWGRGADGQLGYGTMSNKGDRTGTMPPVDVNLGGAVVQVSAGFSHTCALMASGDVICWGGNSMGQLGQGHTYSRGGHHPKQMPPPAVNLGGTRAIQVSAGRQHTCALLETGAVMCWRGGGWPGG